VRRLQSGRTVLLIAHRPELVRHADRVVRLLDGVAASVELAEAA
jgi:ABC-type multidrug transport system fused ATPase/permease subunit